MIVGCMSMAAHIKSKTSIEASTKTIEEDLPSDEIPNLLAPEEQKVAANDIELHKREKKSPWNTNNNNNPQMVNVLFQYNILFFLFFLNFISLAFSD